MDKQARVYAVGSDITAVVKPVYYYGYPQGVRVTLLGLNLAPGRRTFPLARDHVYCSYRAEQDQQAIEQALKDSGRG
jgi:hypothetical protein